MASAKVGCCLRYQAAWSQNREERQGPDAARPGDGCQQHEADPAQTVGLNQVRVRGPHRVTIDAPGLDLGSPTAFDGVIDAQYDRPAASKGGDQQLQQQLAGAQNIPGGPVQDAMVVLKTTLAAEAHRP